MENVLNILKERGLFEDITSPEAEKTLASPCTVYAGFDPSSASLQAGNFVTIMVLSHFQRCGHNVVAVVGGATGRIGDPSFRTSERNMLSEEEVERNQEGIRENLSRFLDFDHPTAPARLVNNYDWFRDFSFIDFLRDVGKHFRMGTMLGKDSVRTRLDSEGGMSFAEFGYQLLQAYDFLKLFEDIGCVLQVGGSDQWGNITAGIDLIHKVHGKEAYGVTTPLICDNAGRKFGKSEGNAVYLNADMTSYYDFYQFFMRTMDADVIRFLRIFTFLPLDEIADLEQTVAKNPEKREAQKVLADTVTRTVHGEEGLKVAQQASAVLFGESMEGLHADELLQIFASVPSSELSRDMIMTSPSFDQVAAEAGLCKSKGEARRLIASGGLYVNNRRVPNLDTKLSISDVVDDKLLVLRSGKKNFHLVRFV